MGGVVDAGSGKPIPAAIVSLGGPAVGQMPRVLTDNEGRFVFRQLPTGTFSIFATKFGYLDGAFGRRRPGGLGQQIELDDGERVGDAVVRMWKQAAIEGMVVDEAGEPVPGVLVRAYHRTIVGGRRSWRPLGTSSGTDDRGMYRIWNLTPGDYVVGIESTTVAVPAAVVDDYQAAAGSNDPGRSAWLRELSTASGGGFSPWGVRIGDLVQPVIRSPTPPPPAPDAPMFVYPTLFYPAAAGPSAATVITLRSGEERAGIDLQVRPARAVRVSGTLIGPDGPVAGVTVRLGSANAEEVTSFSEMNTAAGVSNAAGAFTLLGVTPGQYMLRVAKVPVAPRSTTAPPPIVIQAGSTIRATSGPLPPDAVPPPLPTDPTLWASVPIAVGNRDLSNVVVSLQTGGRVSGRLEFEGTADKPTAEQLQRFPIVFEPADGRLPGASFSTVVPGRVDANGQFTTMSLVGGRYFVRAGGSPPGWTFKSAILEGRDVADIPLDVGASDLKGVVITFTDRPTELGGRVTGEDGNADPGATVVIFPVESSAWRDGGLNPRRIRAVRTTPAGTYSTRGLPAGEYHVIAVPEELAVDWQDSAALETLAGGAATVRLEDGQKSTQDLRVKRIGK